MKVKLLSILAVSMTESPATHYISIIHYHHYTFRLIWISTLQHDRHLLVDCLSGDGVDEQKMVHMLKQGTNVLS